MIHLGCEWQMTMTRTQGGTVITHQKIITLHQHGAIEDPPL
jgi:hypothetical protein